MFNPILDDSLLDDLLHCDQTSIFDSCHPLLDDLLHCKEASIFG